VRERTLPGKVIEDPTLRNRSRVFKDRSHAGRELARWIEGLELKEPLVLAIPSGGVPVGVEIVKALGFEFDLLIARKLQIPGNTEAGFGACVAGGQLFLNEELTDRIRLTDGQINSAEKKTRTELERRNREFRGGKPAPEVRARDVVLVDDGLASGYTMIAATAWAREHKAQRIIVAAPTGSFDTVTLMSERADMVVVPNVREGWRFAVAEAYELWCDLADDEVKRRMEALS